MSLFPALSLLRWWEQNKESAPYLGDWELACEHNVWVVSSSACN